MPASTLNAASSSFDESRVHASLGSLLRGVEQSLSSGNYDKALHLLEDLRATVESTKSMQPLPAMPIRGMAAELDALRARLTATQEKLDTVIGLQQANGAIFSRLQTAFAILQEAENFSQLPDILARIARQMGTTGIALVLDTATYGEFIPKGLGILPQQTLRDIAEGIRNTGENRPYLGTFGGMARWETIQKTLPSDMITSGSCLIHPFQERGDSDHIAGLVCLYDRDVHRYSPDKATDYLEHFCTDLGCTVCLLRVQKFLERERFTDPLTGVPNRAYLMAYGQQILEFAERKSFPVTLVFIDLNGFKAVNDTYGHLAGDAILQQVATCLKNLIRKYDMVVRLSGDEFVVLLPGVAREKTGQLVARMSERIAQITLDKEQSVDLSASIGVAGFEPGQTIQELTAVADQAMYADKRSSR
jgi:diguanylate cyclase (GGDEF)-like protein